MRNRLVAMVVVSLVCAGLAVINAPTAKASTWVLTKIDPCSTGLGIDCESNSNNRHWVYAPTPASNKLAVFFSGTFGNPAGTTKVSEALAVAGYHVINLRYKNGTAANGLCDGLRLSDPDCFRKYRNEVVFGAGVANPDGFAYDSDKVDVNKANSGANRLLQVVDYLHDNYSSQGWGQFQSTTWNATYSQWNPTWSTLTTGGHSQGGGVALYLGKFYALDGTAMFSSPQDGWNEGGTNYVPNWISEGGFDVPLADVYGFDHETEESNMTAQQTANWASLGLQGPITDTDVNSPPYGGSNQLQTSAAPACPLSPTKYHGSTATDNCTPGAPPTHQPVWLHAYGS